ADRGKPEAPEMLAEVLADTSYSALVRASALMRWAELGRPTPVLEEAIQKSSKDNSALIRQAAAKACSELPPEKQMQTLETLATDSTRTVRVLAALCSLEAPRPEKLPSWLEKALTEAKATRTYNADSAGSLLQLAAIERHLGKMPAAE